MSYVKQSLFWGRKKSSYSTTLTLIFVQTTAMNSSGLRIQLHEKAMKKVTNTVATKKEVGVKKQLNINIQTLCLGAKHL